MIYNATKHSLKASYLFYVLAFAFVLYSTFLTRSGILGDSSVHSFTDLGMTGHLLVFIGLFLVPSFLVLAFYWSRLPEKKEEENTSSREFWIFIGMLIIIVSALQITFTTSIPVWNKVFGTKMAPPINANTHYNSIQIWFAIFTLLLMGLSPILKYLKTEKFSSVDLENKLVELW
jgi:cytochrome c-type biogenesis protein CcmF